MQVEEFDDEGLAFSCSLGCTFTRVWNLGSLKGQRFRVNGHNIMLEVL